LFEEKEKRIQKLEGLVGDKSILLESEENKENQKEEEEDWKEIWEKKMKKSLQERIEACVAARELEEYSANLELQLKGLKESIRQQDRYIADLTQQIEILTSNLHSLEGKSENEESAVDKIAEDYSTLSSETETLREQLNQLEIVNKDMIEQRDGLLKQVNLLLSGQGRSEEQEQRVKYLEMELGSLVTASLESQRQIQEELEHTLTQSAEYQEQLEKSKATIADCENRISEQDRVLLTATENTTNKEEIVEGLEAELESSRSSVLKLDEMVGKLKVKVEESQLQVESEVAAMTVKASRDLEKLQLQLEQKSSEALISMQFQHTNDIMGLQSQIESAENERDEAILAIVHMRNEMEQERVQALAVQEEYFKIEKEALLQNLRDEIQNQVDEFKSLYKKEALLRKKVHNELMDLKGNIRVFCRVRPILAVELETGDETCVDIAEYPVDNEIVLHKDEATSNRFEFDAVYEPSTTQEHVFEDVHMLVTSALDGYNVCIFAYGQTGSGKTYTMEGSTSNPGVNFRALARLFELKQDRVHDEDYIISVSVLEIYNEYIHDLLGGENIKLDIGIGTDSKVYVKGLEIKPCQSLSSVKDAMKAAQKNRSVGSHNMNEHSSRSHLVLTVHIESVNKISKVRSYGKLNLIDLAGSERLSKTDASGERLKEAQNINKSLSALGDVIAALGDKSSNHIPYRNSKLTHLLQDSLGGESKVAMFVNISPAKWNVPESICSLNFASRCRKVELGKAKKNGESAELTKYKRMVDSLKSQMAAKSRTVSETTTPKRMNNKSRLV